MTNNSSNNIVYLDYITSATSIASYDSSSKEDSLANIMLNNIIVENTMVAETNYYIVTN